MRNLKYLPILFFFILLCSLALAQTQDYSQTSGSTQNVVNTASAQITPPSEIYTTKAGESGINRVYDSKGNIIGESSAPGNGNFDITDTTNGKITIVDHGAGSNQGDIEFGNFAQDQTIKVSNTERGAEISFAPKQNTLTIDDKHAADVYAGATDLKQITNAEIRITENGSIDYASFVSKKRR